MKLPPDECYWALAISQHWDSSWLGAFRHQTITRPNIDAVPCHHMASLCHNALLFSLTRVWCGVAFVGLTSELYTVLGLSCHMQYCVTLDCVVSLVVLLIPFYADTFLCKHVSICTPCRAPIKISQFSFLCICQLFMRPVVMSLEICHGAWLITDIVFKL